MGFLLDSLDQKTLDNQRDVVKNEYRQRVEDVPYGGSWGATANVAAVFATLASTAATLAWCAAWGRPDDWHAGWVDRLRAASAEEVRSAAATWMAPDKARIVVVGDAKILKPQLADLGALEVW